MVQVTATLVTSDPRAVPVPAETAQLCDGFEGWDLTVTAYEFPSGTVAAKTNVPDAPIDRSLPLLFCRTRPEPVRPVTLPPMERGG